MARRDLGFSDKDGELVVAIDIEECRDLLMASMMSRMQQLGWTEDEARHSCDRACKKAADAMPKHLERMATVCTNAANEGATPSILKTLAFAEFAVGGVMIADDMNKSRIAARN